MPTGTGKTITLLSLITSYQLAHPEVRVLCWVCAGGRTARHHPLSREGTQGARAPRGKCAAQVGKLIYCTRTIPEMEKVRTGW